MNLQYEETIRERRKIWAAALTSGGYVQGKNRLRNSNGDYCCLGVACEVFAKDVGVRSRNAIDYYTFSAGDSIENSMTLPEPVRIYLGLTPNAQSILMALNDSGVSFAVIASLLTYMEIEEPQEK